MSRCKPCVQIYGRKWYRRNRERRIKRVKQYDKLAVARNHKFVFDFLILNPCFTCGERDPVVLEFDHIDAATKDRDIGTMVVCGMGLARIQEEIKKCVVLCANCHRRKTAKQFNTARFRLSNGPVV